MGRTKTNDTTLAFCIESSPGVASTEWFQTEPNEINSFGATITTVARSPISRNRQRRKGTVTDLDSELEYVEDLTLSSFRYFIEGYCFARGVNTDVTQQLTEQATPILNTYSVAPLTAEQASKFGVGTLLWVNGFTNASNLYLKSVALAASPSDTVISVNETLVEETVPNGRLSFAGYRVPSATAVTWTWDGGNKRGTLNAIGLGALLQGLGLTPGQLLHIGSVASIGGAVQNSFDGGVFGYARVVSFPDADNVVFDKTDTTLQVSAPDPAGDLDLVFGEFIRNRPVGDAEYLERTFQFEGTFPNLGDGTPGNTDEAYQYSPLNYANTMSFELPLTDKATITFGFVGTDTENPTTTRKPGAGEAAAIGTLALTGQPLDTETVTIGAQTYTFVATLVGADDVLIGATVSDSLDNLIAAINNAAGEGTLYGTGTVLNADVTAAVGSLADSMDVTSKVVGVAGNSVATTETLTNGSWGAATLQGGSAGSSVPSQTAALNTSSDIARLRIQEVDEDGLTTDFKEMTLTFNNNVTPEKVLGVLGAKFINTGNFDVDIEAQLLFSNPNVITAIRNNETLTMDFIIKNDDGVISVDLPSLTLGGGDREYPVNESVLINTTAQAFADATLNTSVGVSIFMVPLP